MEKTIDWSKAPEWADRVVVGPLSGKKYFANDVKRVDLNGEFSSGNNFHVCYCWKVLEHRPAVAAWNGEGLPPVGTECLTDDKGETFIVKVLAYADKGGKQAVMVEKASHPDFGELHAWMAHMCNFRPIKTAEQIAAEERKAGISALHAIMDGPGYHAAAARLYDAGVRAN